ncbi:hypothetical protein LPUS_10286, partial [Lasallia pustulata]
MEKRYCHQRRVLLHGAIAMYVAGVCKFIPANTFPFAVSENHRHSIGSKIPGAQSVAFNSGQDMYNVNLTLMSFVSFLGAMRTKSPCALAIFGLNFLTVANGAHILKLLKIAGGFGIVTAFCG